MATKYGAEQIKVLEGLEGVKKRPAMYVGSTGKEGLHHLVYEAVDNSVDEALAGFCTLISVTINKDGSVTVEDNGRGIPVDVHPQFNIPAVQVALTKLHAGGKFDKKSYAISGGLHGVGISCVNALSKKLIIEIKRGKKIYQQEYSRGNAKTKLIVVGKCNRDTGTKITFWPDEEIFSVLNFEYKLLETRFREISFLNAGLKINLIDEIKEKKEEFFAAGGLMEFVKWLNKSKEVMHKPIYFKRETNGTILEIAIQYNTGYRENIFGFVNTINTVEGGTHIFGFKTALTRVINDYSRKKGALKNGNLSGDDVREGITAIVSIKIGEPQFEGQTKTKLGNSEIKGFVDSAVTPALAEFFEENPSVARKIMSKALDSAKARLAAKKAKDLVRRKNAFSLGGLPGKLSDCSNKKSDNTELYLVEGESAGGSSRMARNKENQAILPLKGKILNVEKANPVKALSSEEITNMITAIGTGVGEQFNLEKLRYNKIIIMCDADSVTYDTPILLFNKKTKMIEYWLVGDFIENKVNFKNYQVMSFDNGTLVLSDIFNVIKHRVKTKVYSIESVKKYNVEVTGDHSVYVYKDGKVVAKDVRDIKKGEFLVVPNKIPSVEKNIEIDLSSELENLPDTKKKNIWLKVSRNDIKKIPDNALIDICLNDWKKIKLKRQDKFSRRELSKKLGIYFTTLQQWEFKEDHVKPKFSLLKKYFNLVGLSFKNFNYNVLINYSDFEKNVNDKSLLSKAELFNLNTTNPFKLKYKLDRDLAYFIGVYLGDGCYSFNKKSPNRFIFSLNTEDKIFYLPRLEEILKNKFGISFVQSIKGKSLQLHFHSFSFGLLLKKLGLFKLKSAEKFIPDVFYNVGVDVKKSLLEGELHTDGYIHPKEKRLVYTSISKKLIIGVLNLYRQLGIFPNFQTRKAHTKNGRNNKERYDLIINYNELNKIKDIWSSHKRGDLLSEKLGKSKVILKRKDFFKISKDFSAIRITDIKEINYNHKNIYDFSVKKTQNFIAGTGNILLHNTDGEHIKTLLLTFFFRFMPGLIENGNVFVAMPPLYRIRKKKDYYVYSDKELKKMAEKLGTSNVTRFKGLGEMSSTQLWDTTMNPKTRKVKKIFIEDAVEADRTFSMLMGDDVQARKEFIQENAKEAMLDV